MSDLVTDPPLPVTAYPVTDISAVYHLNQGPSTSLNKVFGSISLGWGAGLLRTDGKTKCQIESGGY